MPGFLLNLLFYIVPFLIILGVVVTVHELGHFLAAKWLGTKIDQFSIGFGKPLAAWKDKDGVQWRIGWLPLGGYVRFAGDENAASAPDQDDLEAMRASLVAREGEGALNRYFHFKPLWQRAVITAAGPFANFFLAIGIFTVLLMALGEPVSPARVDGVKPGSPAQAGGFQAGDVVLKADGKKIESFAALQTIVFLRTDTPIRFIVERDGRPVELVATPKRGVIIDRLGHEQRLGVLGLEYKPQPGDFQIKRYGPLAALSGGVERTWEVISTTVHYLGRLFVGRETAEQLSGPLGMAQLSGDIAKKTSEASPNASSLAVNGLITMLELIANISVGIGFLNLMPIPVLDGGHLLFYGYEAIARRPLAAKVQAAGYRVGLALVLGLMLFATWNDLQRLRVFKLFGGLFS
ncbi:M50 family metallopeptidase [Phenylobacterium deserti]|uniref:RIP metalloprotease RseP n=1 Tax=Phenylobacterium deserti TaxID=1914756 RepID=A0A328AE46_9CAUL|nr:M50 family metallopeptidase [Phenylobacterium deserti]RAK52940.1 RIP metalloprotease RseP [Phenylobacterium deserti]